MTDLSFGLTVGSFLLLSSQKHLRSVAEDLLPVDPGVTNRPIRFKLTARTDDPKHLAN